MILPTIKSACRAGHRAMGLARTFQRRHLRLKHLQSKSDSRRGFLFRTRRFNQFLTTQIFDLSAEVHFHDVDASADFGSTVVYDGAAKLDREDLYVPPAEPLTPEVSANTAPEVTQRFGVAPPTGAFTKGVYGGDIQPDAKQGAVRAVTRFLSDVDFRITADQSVPEYSQLVPDTVGLWLDTELWFVGGSRQRYTFSEGWLQSMAPGYRLVSTAHEITVPMPVTHCVGDGTAIYFSVVMRKQRGPYVRAVWDPDTYTSSGNCRDRGHTALLTFCLAPGDDGLEVSWHHLWELETEFDERLRSAAYPTDTSDANLAPNTFSDEYLGVAPNDIVPTLAVTPTGLEAMCLVYASRAAIDDGVPQDRPNLRRGTYVAQSVVTASWSPAGVFSRTVEASNLYMSRVAYDYLAANPANLTHIDAVVAWADLFGVGTVDKTADIVPFYYAATPGVFDSAPKYFFPQTNLILSLYDPEDVYADADGWVPATLGLSDSGQYPVYQTDKGGYMVYDPQVGGQAALWRNILTGLAPSAGQTIAWGQAGRSAVTGFYASATPVGSDRFVSLVIDEVAAAIRMTEFVVGGNPELRTFDIPSAGGGVEVSCHQCVETDESGAVVTDSGLCIGGSLGCFVSSDGGRAWTQLADVPVDFPTLVGNPLWDMPPYRLLEL